MDGSDLRDAWERHKREHLGGKWFEPIFAEIEAFEEETASIVPEIAKALEDDDYPVWAIRSLFQMAKKDSDFTGIAPLQGINARRIGKIIGCKYLAFAIWPFMHQGLKTAKLREKDSGAHAEMIEEMILWTGRCKAGFSSRFIQIKQKAIHLAGEQGGFEEVDFLQGFAVWREYLARLRQRVRPEGKRAKDSNRKLAVLFRAFLCARKIEQEKGRMTWEELTDFLARETGDHELDSATVKKNLQPLGLKGVGKVGRPRSKK